MIWISFDALFTIMEQKMPVITNATRFEDVCDLAELYYDDDLGVFIDSLCDAIMTAAQWEGLDKGESYRIADLDRAQVRSNFEERLRYGLTHPDIGYTARDIELVSEYLRTGYITTTPDAALVQSKEIGQEGARKL